MKKIFPDFKENILIPTVIHDYKTKEVLMLGFNSKSSFKNTLVTGWVWFWSRTRNKLWNKGEKSGNKFKVRDISIDCDRDTLLIEVELIGKNACHKGTRSCFTDFNL